MIKIFILRYLDRIVYFEHFFFMMFWWDPQSIAQMFKHWWIWLKYIVISVYGNICIIARVLLNPSTYWYIYKKKKGGSLVTVGSTCTNLKVCILNLCWWVYLCRLSKDYMKINIISPTLGYGEDSGDKHSCCTAMRTWVHTVRTQGKC